MINVSAWEDDPKSDPFARPISRPVPALKQRRLGVAVVGEAPPPGRYRRGTDAFRFWNAADSLTRGAQYWAGLMPEKARWHTGDVLPAMVDAGNDLNAYYDRHGLYFFHDHVGGEAVYSGESPDVLCHELGHAVLDALAPALWNAAAIEAAALHESFGDISAMLSALELESVRTAVLTETAGRLSRSSRISRLAEQLGWAIRQSHPDAVDRDCLRNAANSFFYSAPESLPPLAPASALSSEPHSFSRVFTATFLDALAGMADIANAIGGASHPGQPREAGQAGKSRDADQVGHPRTPGQSGASRQSDQPGRSGGSCQVGWSADDLLRVSRDAGALLVHAVERARIASNYFAQVAAEVLQADADLFHGNYREALRRAFVGRGVLSSSSAAMLTTGNGSRTRPAATGAGGSTTRWVSVPIEGATFGLRVRRLLVEAPPANVGLGVTSAAPDLGSLPPVSSERASLAFVEDLFRRDRIDPGDLAVPGGPRVRVARTTHRLERHGRDVKLVRRRFH
ncbi:MAG: hypothetical protein NTV05_02535 [Acidobacteria bacterium]|nr:hypothetical protein [Acidobacteriota bacterium]